MKKYISIIMAVLAVFMLFSCSEKETAEVPGADGALESGSLEALFMTVCTADEGYELAKNNDVVLFDDCLVSGKEVWDAFYSATEKGEPAKVLVADYYVIGDNVSEEYYEEHKDEYPKLYFTYLEYNGNDFYYSSRLSTDKKLDSDGQYKYLKHYTGKMPETARYEEYDIYVLVDDPDVTYEELWWSVLSSQSTDFIRHNYIYMDYIGLKE